jgi:hypothetical protein
VIDRGAEVASPRAQRRHTEADGLACTAGRDARPCATTELC